MYSRPATQCSLRNWPYAWGLAQADDSLIKGLVGRDGPSNGRRRAACCKHWADWSYAVLGNQAMCRKSGSGVRGTHDFGRVPVDPRVGIQPGADEHVRLRRPALAEGAPFIAGLQEHLPQRRSRPASVAGENYSAVSTEFYNTVHAILSGTVEAGPALAELEANITGTRRALSGRDSHFKLLCPGDDVVGRGARQGRGPDGDSLVSAIKVRAACFLVAPTLLVLGIVCNVALGAVLLARLHRRRTGAAIRQLRRAGELQ